MSDLIQLEPIPQPPRLPGTVVVRPTVEELTDAIAADLLLHANNGVRTFGDFHLALSGGSTPVPLYRRLMIDPRYRAFPWTRVHLWIVDERRVSFDDDRSNFKLISELIGDHSGIPANQVHPIYAMADDADEQYERTLRETLGWREPGHDRLDFVLLGMGDDGHTASLFPHSPALPARAPTSTAAAADARAEDVAGGGHDERLVLINAGPAVTPPDRVTMTYRLINASRFVAVMVTGAGKRRTLERVAAAAAGQGAEAYRELPILGVRPVGGELRWYLDHAACPEDGDEAGADGRV
jgi:6-phosphogluconolactonase